MKNVKMYGYQITKKAKEITKGHLEITEGALYPILHKLEIEGHIYSEIQNINGRERKYYLLTENGKQKQVDLQSEMKAYIFNLKTIFNDID
jgi:DNA-binding PadR family transcriptional regulator